MALLLWEKALTQEQEIEILSSSLFSQGAAVEVEVAAVAEVSVVQSVAEDAAGQSAVVGKDQMRNAALTEAVASGSS